MKKRLKKYAFLIATIVGTNLSAQEQQVELQNLQDIIKAGGWPMIVIVALSILVICLLMFFILTIRRNSLMPKKFLLEAQRAAEEHDIEALEVICSDPSNNSPAASIIGAAAKQLVRDPGTEYLVIRDAIEDEGTRQAGAIWQRIQYLMDIGVVAPMVGLLGTVLGMMESFTGLQSELGAVKPIALAGGVSKALITTAGGLIVGIAAMLIYSVLRGRVNYLINELENQCSSILNKVITKKIRKN
ncbi:MAG: MotA/TolQ/ExbB proton channel family protein [Verrucomicrobiota bacterium]|nr:MotA/TolQ/ExbB proton channel family protein [Verrucomicrobiota bacterium]